MLLYKKLLLMTFGTTLVCGPAHLANILLTDTRNSTRQLHTTLIILQDGTVVSSS